MSNPILTYALQTAPSPVATSEKLVLTLMVSNPTPNPVTISQIAVYFPPEGTAATDLSDKQASMPTSADPNPQGWDIFQRDSSTFQITPTSTASGTLPPGEIYLKGQTFTFGPFEVNANEGTATLNIRENIGNGWSDYKKFEISKWPPSFSLSALTASETSVAAGTQVQLSWDMSGDADLTLSYGGQSIDNPTSPYTTDPVVADTVFTLTATSSFAGQPVTEQRQVTVELNRPRMLTYGVLFQSVYQGQGNTLYWTTQQADGVKLSAIGTELPGLGPAETGQQGFALDASYIKGSTPLAFQPMKGQVKGEAVQWTIFGKVLVLQQPFGLQRGWGALAVDQIGQFAYICNTATNALDKVDLSTGKAVDSLPVGLGPRGAAITPDGAQVLVSNAFDNTLSLIDIASGAFVDAGSISDVTSPAGLDVLGGTIFVASTGATPQILTVNLGDQTQGTPIPVSGTPMDVAVNPNGRTLYVANSDAAGVDVYDIGTATKTATVPVKSPPTTVAMDPGGASVYAGARTGSALSVIDAHAGAPVITTTAQTYTAPLNLGVSGDGRTVAMVGASGFYIFQLAVASPSAKAMALAVDEA